MRENLLNEEKHEERQQNEIPEWKAFCCIFFCLFFSIIFGTLNEVILSHTYTISSSYLVPIYFSSIIVYMILSILVFWYKPNVFHFLNDPQMYRDLTYFGVLCITSAMIIVRIYHSGNAGFVYCIPFGLFHLPFFINSIWDRWIRKHGQESISVHVRNTVNIYNVLYNISGFCIMLFGLLTFVDGL
jgi:Na+-driven multidrug efflux pump